MGTVRRRNRHRGRTRRPHVVIGVVNLPAERDRRVIRECRALEAGGYRVTVICPGGEQRLDVLPGTADTRIRSFRQGFAGSGVVSFAVEFVWSLLCVAWHLSVLLVRDPVAGAQVCNPPDVFWPLALAMRALGKPWIFDHHDLCPELYACKVAEPNPLVTRVARRLRAAVDPVRLGGVVHQRVVPGDRDPPGRCAAGPGDRGAQRAGAGRGPRRYR